MQKNIYLDYAATTPMDPQVERVVLKHLKDSWGNASSVHRMGQQAKKIIDNSRKRVAGIIGSRPEEIIFTGSGTESANLAIFGVARAYKNLGKHIVTSKIEHHAVLHVCQYLEKHEGFKVDYLDVNRSGIIDPESVRKALRPDTILVSIMYANNEIGTVQPIAKIGKILKESKNKRQKAGIQLPFFHSDVCQAAGALNLNVKQLDVDLMTLNGSKIYGPKGVGCLYVRRGANPMPLIVGGSQEQGMRAGTENTALIAGFAEALELADKIKIKENIRLIKLRDYVAKSILKSIPASRLNGDPIQRLPNNINISFNSLDADMLMLALDQKGIQVSTGSACTASSTEQSHVMSALKQASGKLFGGLCEGNIRITLGRQTTKNDLNYVLKVLQQVVEKLRK